MRCFLPHEILHCLSDHPTAFKSLLLGSLDERSIYSFWEHCRGLDAWSSHPIYNLDGDYPLHRTIPLCIHGDGAEIFREDEMFIYSLSSALGSFGCVQGILLFKFPFVIIPERHMRSASVSHPHSGNHFVYFPCKVLGHPNQKP